MTDEDKYLYACYLYYRGIGAEEQSPLSDYEFDELQARLKKDKTEGHSLAYTLTPEQIQAAIDWANQ